MQTTNGLTTRDKVRLAAVLFATAGRHRLAGRSVALHSLAACAALGVHTGPVPPVPDHPGPDVLITRALRALGELHADDFAQPAVVQAARHGRRALIAVR
ncbi:hypothetical protein [Klenkia taihuensis]|uniref:Uncharacterized protein n=1 Tax=Klenkia taihuensis TaxID=1225127 RepID=A0A1I1U5Q8_9ACTN|nr:hypothetical protein [Klenkia taihuensis]GHE06910.1 hypothetical protein GCM10011381_00680 [Klenkia taihuensis]SFD66166.1 hypothetical protein SAMN05661030_3931 [Klenkia taihuensis]